VLRVEETVAQIQHISTNCTSQSSLQKSIILHNSIACIFIRQSEKGMKTKICLPLRLLENN